MKIIEKPWGRENVLEKNGRYMMKKLTMWKGHRCSLQYHKYKQETIYILSGKMKIISGPSLEELSSRLMGPNETINIKPGTVHRMEAVEDSEYLEASSPEMDDVIRLEDDYQRKVE